MLSLHKTTLGLVVALFVCSQLAYSQQNDSSPKPEAVEAALREKAFAALESLANQLGSLQSAENRARLGLNIVESLWKHDENRARTLFQLVRDDIKLGLQPPRDHARDGTLKVFLKLREDTVRRMAKHDAELALEFLRETFPIVQEQLSHPGGVSRVETAAREKSLEVELARALARKDPEHALKLARKTLAQGFDDGLFMLLLQLSDKHKDEARLLHKEIVSKLGETNLRIDHPALEFTRRLVEYFNPPAADETTYRELLEILLKTALASGCAGSEGPPMLCYAIGNTVPRMERFFPARAAQLKRWVPEYVRASGTGSYPELRYQIESYIQDGSVDDILALVSQYPAMEAEIFSSAMRKAEYTGDFERAQKIANDYKGDPQLRQRMIERVESYQLTAARNQALLEEIQKEIEGMDPARKIDALLRLANHTATQDPKTSLKALSQVREPIENLKPGPFQARAQIAVAVIYCLAKSDEGFAVMEAMLPKLNELIAAGAKLDGYDTKYLRDGEWNMSAEGEIGQVLNILAGHARYFAWQDFDRAMNLAAQFERGEIRMMAQLKLAQGILAGHPKRLARQWIFR
ncbi:MAG TPA: hypothetical protein VFT02_06110 [Pyrinomonadaceae bacterium]|nr:hypothetical protein [Pyrinomonadaceae bacterium]